jgi:hypothetical protein
MLNIASVIINLACIIYHSFLCPYIGGPAVYEARAIIYSQDANLVFDDQDLYANVAMRKRKDLVNATFNNSLKIYPNPASTILNFSGSFEGEAQLIVESVIGETILNEITVSGNSVSVANIENGIYLYTIIANGQIRGQGKIAIVH